MEKAKQIFRILDQVRDCAEHDHCRLVQPSLIDSDFQRISYVFSVEMLNFFCQVGRQRANQPPSHEKAARLAGGQLIALLLARPQRARWRGSSAAWPAGDF